jgi:hypothetical protein
LRQQPQKAPVHFGLVLASLMGLAGPQERQQRERSGAHAGFGQRSLTWAIVRTPGCPVGETPTPVCLLVLDYPLDALKHRCGMRLVTVSANDHRFVSRTATMHDEF